MNWIATFFLVQVALICLYGAILHRLFKKKMGMVSDQIDWFAPSIAFPLAYSLVYGISAMKLTYWEAPINIGQYLIYFTGLCAYFFGLLIMWSLRKKKNQFTILIRNPTTEKFILSVLYVVTALIGVYVFIKAGNPLFASNVEEARLGMVSKVGGWLIYFCRTNSLIYILIVVHFYKYKGSGGFKKNLVLLFGLVAAFLALSSGFRAQLFTIMIAIVIARNYLVRPLKWWQIALGILLILGLLAFLGALRNASALVGITSVMNKLLIEIQNPAYAVLLIWEEVPQNIPFLKGLFIGQGFLNVLPGNQQAMGWFLKEAFNLHYSGGGFAPSILGGFYLDMGWFGVFGGMLFVGVMLGGLYSKILSTASPYNVVIYSYTLVYSLGTIRAGFLKEVIPIWFLLIMITFRFKFEGHARSLR